MSTRSFIGRVQKNGTVLGVYCHNDGYPEGVGRILTENYQDERIVTSLIRLGGLSTLGTGLQVRSGTRAYARDMGEPHEDCEYLSVQDAVKNARLDFDAAYVYIYDTNGQWNQYTSPGTAIPSSEG